MQPSWAKAFMTSRSEITPVSYLAAPAEEQKSSRAEHDTSHTAPEVPLPFPNNCRFGLSRNAANSF